LAEKARRRKHNQIQAYFPDTGPLRRELYPKHLEFFAAGKDYAEVAILAANRIGKSLVGAYEVTLHLTGLYAHWWQGRRFNRPIKAWACGDSHLKTKEVVQTKLFGPSEQPNEIGTGMIPGALIAAKPQGKSGLTGAIDSALIRHHGPDGRPDGLSALTLKAYQQGAEGFAGDKIDVIWLDERPPMPVYVECLMRTMATVPGEANGRILFTLTPWEGWTDVVTAFLSRAVNRQPDWPLIPSGGDAGTLAPELSASKYVVIATWDDAPHLTEANKAALLAEIPDYQRQARTKGLPTLGKGAIYQAAEADIVVAPFEIPEHWPRVFGMDVGWNRTAAVWGARNNETGTIYLYHEYYRSHAEPIIHAEGIKAPGTWIPGVIDPAGQGRSQVDGKRLIDEYRVLGLRLDVAVNAVEAGIFSVFQGLTGGKLKVFANLGNWLAEYRVYRRNDDGSGRVVKENDHLMDATRYLWMSGRDRMALKPALMQQRRAPVRTVNSELGWMA